MLHKQPATIAWIDRFEPDSVMWDVGANVGVYTLYAALLPGLRVVAFEPAAVNYFLLAANCEANRLNDRVQCLLAGLSRESGLGTLAVSQFATGQSFGFGGKKAERFDARQAALMLTMDQAVETYGLRCPNYVKIDVPRLSVDVLEGGMRTLRRAEVREVHIEANVATPGGRRIAELLRRAGFALAEEHTHGVTADVTFVRRRR
jgi:FkbM family methyltransferase